MCMEGGVGLGVVIGTVEGGGPVMMTAGEVDV